MTTRSAAEYKAHCAVLGLQSVRTEAELKSAYRPLILRWHPDRHHGTAVYTMALARAKAINEAYRYLSSALEDAYAPDPSHRTSSRPASTDGFPDASVLEIFVKTSSILSVGYNSASSDLYIKFIGNRVYRYSAVPPHVFEALMSASSLTTFANKHVVPRYAYEVCR